MVGRKNEQDSGSSSPGGCLETVFSNEITSFPDNYPDRDGIKREKWGGMEQPPAQTRVKKVTAMHETGKLSGSVS